MGGDGAEGASAETASMEVDGEFYHLVGGYALTLVFGVRHALVGEVERGIDLLSGHGRIRGVDDHAGGQFRVKS